MCSGREPKVCRDPDQADPKLVVEGDRRRPVGPAPPLEGNPNGPEWNRERRTRTIRAVSQKRTILNLTYPFTYLQFF
jgi:hypothetical protein